MNAIPPYGEFDYFNLFPEFQGAAEEVNKLSLQMVQRIHDYVGGTVFHETLVLPFLCNGAEREQRDPRKAAVQRRRSPV